MINKVTRREIAATLFQHGLDKQFLTFIDYGNRESQRNSRSVKLDFPKEMYFQFYKKYIQTENSPYLSNIFDLNTLIQAGVFTPDNNEDTLTICPQLYEFLTWMDVERAIQYSNHQLEACRSNIVSTVDHLSQLNMGTEEFDDAKSYFNNIVANIISQIQANIAVLELRVTEIATLYQDYENGSSGISINDLYKKANDLYVKNIKPCLEFVSPSFELRHKETFSQALDRLIDYFNTLGLHDEATVYRYKMGTVNSYYKDIDAVAKKLQLYIKNITNDRQGYMAIEAMFSDLVDSLDGYRHGRTVNRLITINDEFFENNLLFTGLFEFASSQNKNASKLNYQANLINMQFEIFYEDFMSKPLKEKRPKVSISSSNLKVSNINAHRRQALFDELQVIAMPITPVDIVAFLNDYYRSKFPDFQLIDLLYVLEKFKQIYGKNHLKKTNVKSIVEDDCYYFEYLQTFYSLPL